MKAVVVLSGGQDSTTCLYATLAACSITEVHAVTFNYGQRHSRELEAAKFIAEHAHVVTGPSTQPRINKVSSHEIIDLGAGILESTSPLVSGNELEQYVDHHSLPGGIEKTFVPMRNQLFLTIAANRAVARGADLLVTGVCQEDFGGYPDCREVFINSLQQSINLSNEGAAKPLEIMTPLMHMTKAQSIELATSIAGCYGMLAYTHTAYDGTYPPKGKDHATLLRAKGFEEADIPDPLVLRAVGEGLMKVPETNNYSAANITKWSAVMMRDLIHQGL